MSDIEKAMALAAARKRSEALSRRAGEDGQRSQVSAQSREIESGSFAAAPRRRKRKVPVRTEPSGPRLAKQSEKRLPAQPAERLVKQSPEPLPAEGVSITLPLARLAQDGFITPELARGRLSEEFRRLKRPILKNIDAVRNGVGNSNIVMVTSSISGEGKTYTAINLAMSLALERERTVLLIDADVVRGTAGKTLGVPADSPGLTDVLADSGRDLASVILGTDVPNLRIVPSGTQNDGTNELLSSGRMKALTDDLSGRYRDRIVVLDCPPMLQTNEANVIADHAGQVVFVVAGEETDQRMVIEAVGRFRKEQPVGVLLNKAGRQDSIYGYDYRYE